MDNLLFYAVVVAVLTVIPIVVKTLRSAYFSPLSKIPGPWHAHISNLSYKIAAITGDRPHYIHALHKRYGPIVRLSPREISAVDVDSFKTIHNARSNFGKDQWYRDVVFQDRPVIFSIAENKDHAVRRRLFARGFQKHVLRTQWEEQIKERVDLAVQKIKGVAQKEGAVDVLSWWSFLSADVAGLVLYGEVFGLLDAGENNDFIRSLTTRMTGSGMAVELPILSAIAPLVPFQGYQDLFRGSSTIRQHSDQAVAKMRSGQTQSVFTHITAEAEKGDPTLTDEDVANEAMNLITAGSDTTGVGLTYIIWSVLRQPREALQGPLEAEVGALSEHELTDENLEKLPILNAVIAEMLRLWGPSPGPLFRVVPSEGANLCGYHVPGGTTVSAQAWTLHRLPELWGDDAEVFDHTRWLPENEAKRVSAGAKATFSPWGGAPHTCLGLHMAYMEMRLATAIFFRECKGARLASGMRDEDMEIESYFLNKPRGKKCMISV